MIKFPYTKHNISNSDITKVINVLKTGYLTQGPIQDKFEEELEKTFTSSNVILVNSGTAALHLIYEALGLGAEAALLTSPITFLATANAARMCNAPVIFADVDSKTGLMTPENIEKAIINADQKIKVITVVHLGGKVCDMEAIAKVAHKYDCFVVEDACHAPGASYVDSMNNKSRVGSCEYSIATTYSFHAIKHIAMGEGGCVSTNDISIAKKIRLKRNHGIIRHKEEFTNIPEINAPWYYEMKELGWNYRPNEISCALGLNQLKRLFKGIEERKNIIKFYIKEFENIDNIMLPCNISNIDSSVWHLFPVSINFKDINISRGSFMKSLLNLGIGTQVHYIPLFYQPYYKINPANFPGAIEYYNSTLSLPLYIGLKKKDIKFISNTIINIIHRNLK